MPTRRHFASQLGTLAALGIAGIHPSVHSQQPDMARLLVGFPPGGSTDTVARRLAEHMRGSYAAQVIVDNRPGAATQLAVAALRSSAPDGGNLLLSPADVFSVYPFTYKKLPYASTDVLPVAQVCNLYIALAVGPAVPATVKSVGDFVSWIKDNPAKANFGSPAAGSTLHLTGNLFARMAGIELTHIAYRGDGPGLQDLMGGQVAAYVTVLGSYMPHLKSDRLRLLAVSGKERSPFIPEVPTFRDQGHELNLSGWFGVYLPAGAPAAVVERAAQSVRAAVEQPAFVKGLADFGMTPNASTPQAMADRLRAETQEWRDHIQRIGFSSES